MKKFLILFLMLVITSLAANAISNWYGPYHPQVGLQPVGIYEFSNSFNNYPAIVLCAGIDSNYNGKLDSGDVPPSLWGIEVVVLSIFGSFDGGFGASKITDLDMNLNFPFRPAFDKESGIMYYSGINGIQKISISNQSFKKEDYLPLKPAAISIGKTNSGAKRLYLSMRPSNLSPGYVLVYEVNTKKQIDSIPAYINVQMTYPVDTTGLLIINEGNFGSNDSRLQYIAVGGNLGGLMHKTLLDTIIGGDANHIDYDSLTNTAAITCNSSLQVKIINLTTLKIDTIAFNVSQYDGPRESIFSSLGLLTSCYDGKVYGSSLGTLDAGGKAEGLCLFKTHYYLEGGILGIATPFKTGTYDKISTITIYSSFNPMQGIDDNIISNDITISPNPVTDNMLINIGEIAKKTISSIEIFNNLGIKAGIINIEDIKSNISIKNMGLLPGAYYMRINSGKNVKTIKFVVI